MCRFFLVTLLACSLSGCDRPEPSPADRLALAAEYLWNQQAEDGGWHSETHGLLRGGQAWTPFVLNALINVPEDVYAAPAGGIERGLQFIRDHTNAAGVLGLADPVVLEYPNYATAYALRVFAERGAPEDSALVRRMSEYLAGQQFTEQRGINPDHLAYGAWGFGETNLVVGEIGHVDLSHTRRVLQGLRAAGLADSSVYTNAIAFLHFIQKHPDDLRPQPPGRIQADTTIYDGGFYGSPTAEGINKGGVVAGEDGEPGYFRTYATTTADGILALLAAGHDSDDTVVQEAAGWLRAHPDWETPAGIPTDDPGQWHRVMFFYHLAVRAEAYAALDEPGPWRAELFQLIAQHQHEDGHFSNPDGARNRNWAYRLQLRNRERRCDDQRLCPECS